MPRTTKRKYRQKSKTRAKRAGTKRKRVTRRAKSGTRRVKKATKKVIAKRKRRVKLINKTIKRVQTKLADEVVVMRRMKPLNQRLDGVVANAAALDTRAELTDGQLCLNKYIGLPVKYSDWWNINAFHGYIQPRYFIGPNQIGGTDYDPNWEPARPWESYSDLYLQDTVSAPGTGGLTTIESVCDIRAYDQREIPFLPCVPKHIEHNNDNSYLFNSRLNQFARKGERIKIRSNYMRFNFYVRPGLKDVVPVLASRQQYEHAVHHPPISPGDSSTSDIGGVPGAVKEYTIAAKSMAKARIIVVKRTDDHDAPINLNDFLKDNNPYSMGDEGYRMMKYFYRKYKTDNDIIVNTSGDMNIVTEAPNPANSGKVDYEVTKLKDISNDAQRGLHNVTIMYDKVHNLRVGTETTVKLSLMKGTVLTYEAQNPAIRELYTNQGGAYGNMVNDETANPEIKSIATNNDKLPISTNEVLRKLNMNPSTQSKAEHNEYVPKGAKYAAFLLLMNQKCSTEYQIFQKFEFDN